MAILLSLPHQQFRKSHDLSLAVYRRHTLYVQQVPVWYVMDEFGSRIPHSDNPSIAMTSFLYVPRQLAYCVFWTLRDLKFGGETEVVGVRGCDLLSWQQIL